MRELTLTLQRRLLAAIVLCLTLVGVAPSAAAGATTRCRIGYFAPGLGDSRFPTIHRLRAIDLPRRTDGYAPRCLVAETVADLVKRGTARAFQENGSDFTFDDAPRSVSPMGARWNGGTYRVRYTLLRCDCDPYVRVSARQGDKRVKLLIGGAGS